MILDGAPLALQLREVPRPEPGPGQILIEVSTCGICRTDLHILDGELTEPKLPLIPGHQIVGRVAELGPGVAGLAVGDRVGVPWLGATCGQCRYCRGGRENLCARARFTGYHLDGGFAEYAVAAVSFCFAIPSHYSDAHAAPLLCAGLIGYRSLVMAGDAERIGLYGIGAAAHIVAQMARFQGCKVYAFTRDGDLASQAFARSLGAVWAGASSERPPDELDAAIIFAPVGALVPQALSCMARGGRVVCAGIHMSEIPAFRYELLWGERSLHSVTNLTRKDGRDFLALAATTPLHTEVTSFPLEAAGAALDALRHGRFQGAGVLLCR